MTYASYMVENTSHTVTERKRKSRALEAKRKSAEEKGITLIEGALVAIKGKEFSVYRWDSQALEYKPIYTGVLDET